eukprot:g2886.t1
MRKDQLQELEVLSSFAANMQALVKNLAKINEQVNEISETVRNVEKKVGAVHTPFSTSVYEYKSTAVPRGEIERSFLDGHENEHY